MTKAEEIIPEKKDVKAIKKEIKDEVNAMFYEYRRRAKELGVAGPFTKGVEQRRMTHNQFAYAMWESLLQNVRLYADEMFEQLEEQADYINPSELKQPNPERANEPTGLFSFDQLMNDLDDEYINQ